MSIPMRTFTKEMLTRRIPCAETNAFYRQLLQLFDVIRYRVSFDIWVRFFNEQKCKSE